VGGDAQLKSALDLLSPELQKAASDAEPPPIQALYPDILGTGTGCRMRGIGEGPHLDN
jgi:hypothetical protein